MKKAEDILQSFIKGDIKRDYSEQDKQYYTVYLQSAIDAIKIAQEEAIRETVKECAENVKMSHRYYNEYDNKISYLKFKNSGFPRCDQDGLQYGVDILEIDKNSILSIADKLIKEL